jgi:hypothetical protein
MVVFKRISWYGTFVHTELIGPRLTVLELSFDPHLSKFSSLQLLPILLSSPIPTPMIHPRHIYVHITIYILGTCGFWNYSINMPS